MKPGACSIASSSSTIEPLKSSASVPRAVW
jgi:hypothetical protein